MSRPHHEKSGPPEETGPPNGHAPRGYGPRYAGCHRAVVRPGRGRRALEGVGAAVLAGVVLAGLLAPGALAVDGVTRTLASAVEQATGRLDTGPVPAGSVLLDADGEPFARLYDRYGEPVGADRIADAMKAAVVAVEDRRFAVHEGVDWRGIGRALVRNALNGSPLEGQGASTITMQYVKNRRLFDARTPAEERAATADTVQRKLTEAQIARRLERRLSKRKILTRYLNLVYFGRGAYGVEAAARAWFGTSAADLTVPQAALLAGMVQSPERLDPVDHPDAARGRRAAVLAAMVSVGALSPARADRAGRGPLVVRPDAGAPPQGCAAARPGTGIFCRAVLDQLVRDGLDRDAVRRGGYVIRTTLDPWVTARAGEAVRAASGAAPDVLTTTAVVAPDPAGRECSLSSRTSPSATTRTPATRPTVSRYGRSAEPGRSTRLHRGRGAGTRRRRAGHRARRPRSLHLAPVRHG